MSEADTVPIETLLQHRAWVRHLARTLVRDSATAEDIEQRTWLRAMASPPRKASAVRTWLARVVRSQALNEFRSSSRRREHESRALGRRTTRSPADITEEVESHKRLVVAVMGLSEPYRTTILLRFYEDLPPRAVAREMRTPVETVRTRTRRALSLLRQQLGGDTARHAWLGAIAPLIGAGRDGSLGASASVAAAATTSAATAGGIAMAGKTTIVAAVALGCASGFVGARLAGPGLDSEVSSEVATLEARVADLEAAREVTPTLRGKAASDPVSPPGMREARNGPLLEAALLDLLDDPSSELRARLSEVLKKPAAEPGEDDAALSALEKKIVDGMTKAADEELDRWVEIYDLADHQVAELKALTRSYLKRAGDAKRAGASPKELAAMEVETQAEVRKIVGDEVYAATERERVTREARGALTWLSAAVGLLPAQHTQLDRILEEGVERALPDVIRIRSEPLADEERERLETRLKQMREADWQRIQNEVLTEEQRRRIPGK